MSKYRKIVWNEGMLLTPHHFQQWDNYYEELVNSRVRSVLPFEYGILDLQINREAIANGNFQLTNCHAVLPDGLLINVPDTEAVPDLRPAETIQFLDERFASASRALRSMESLGDFSILLLIPRDRLAEFEKAAGPWLI